MVKVERDKRQIKLFVAEIEFVHRI